jgi:hypothetical protein
MDLREEVGECDPPAWAAEPIAWASCLANAALPTAVVDAVLRAVKSPMPATATFALYVCAFSLLVWALKPWSARPR